MRSGIHTRGYLPHVKREGARYFVTFRLGDSLPKEVWLKIQGEHAQALVRFYAEKEAAEKSGTAGPASSTLEEIERAHHRRLEEYLDLGHGECWLARPNIAELVASALRYFDESRYVLKAWVVMPNHVHAVLWPMPNHTLSGILQSWKSFTGRKANKQLNRVGQQFWQRESFDHWIRNDEEHARCCSYVINNPVKARLSRTPQEWRWSSAW